MAGCTTVIHTAASQGDISVLETLLENNENDINGRNEYNQTPLHLACIKGHLPVVLVLLDHGADVHIRDGNNDTPLNKAALYGHKDILCALITNFGSDQTVVGYKRRTLLHQACDRGHLELIDLLISKFNSDPLARDKDGNNPLHIAVSNGQVEAANLLITKHSCPVDSRNNKYQTPLHLACIERHLSVVKMLVTAHKADSTAHDDYTYTILHDAAIKGHQDIVFTLIDEFGCDPNLRGFEEKTLLHQACAGGHLELIDLLISKFNNDPLACDQHGNTPLHIAVLSGQMEAASLLIAKYKCPVDCRNGDNQTPLHLACIVGLPNVVRMFVTEHKADVTAQNSANDTPLHNAASNGHIDIVCILIDEFGCDPRMKGYAGNTLLHQVCTKGYTELVQTIVQMYEPIYGLLLLCNDNGDTPLHVCSSLGKVDCVQFLLYNCHAPIFVRNKAGQTPKDISSKITQPLFTNYLKSQQSVLQKKYKLLQANSVKFFPGAQLITRVFALGNPGAGKSTLVESLKRKGLFKKISRSTAPPHTTGIVPSIHNSTKHGKLLFYDFAGDREYYSSHAAILERVVLSSQGVSVFLLVVNISNEEKEIKEELGYWLSFITFHSKSIEQKSIVQIVASHADKEKSVADKLQSIQTYSLRYYEKYSQGVIEILSVISLDCRYPSQMRSLKATLETQAIKQPPCSLSLEATLLHGLLEKDFKNVTACKVQTVLNHIEETRICLPIVIGHLYSILKQLHDVGLLMIIGRKDEVLVEHSLILKPSALTNQVHKSLFAASDSALPLRQYTTGLIPEDELLKIFPEYITAECLVQLQYCQEFSHITIGLDSEYSITIDEATGLAKRHFYFPALCEANHPPNKLLPADLIYKLGWYAECKNEYDYFPPRFMHVLLLRLANTFALPSQYGEYSNSIRRRCTMWKNGLKWNMNEGVACFVEIITASKGVVVFTASSEDLAQECTAIFAKIVNKVLETKAEFCHSVELQLYLVKMQEPEQSFDPEEKCKLFSVNEINKAIRDGQFTVVSVDKKGQHLLDHNVLCHIGEHTYWGELFLFSVEIVVKCLKDVVMEWFDLGLALGLPDSSLREIEADNPAGPGSAIKRKREMIRQWMTSSQEEPPCWWTLMKALRSIDLNGQAAEIEASHGLEVSLQNPEKQTVKPDEVFLESFAEVVGARWPSLAALLSLTTSEIEEIRRHTQDSPPSQQALHMLTVWSRKETATYGLLCERLKKITIFGY